MIEALWSVEFLSNMNSVGSGIVVIETGRVLGGDSAYMYIGDIRVEQSTVHAVIRVTQYSSVMGMTSIFHPLTQFTLKVSGPLSATDILFNGYVVEQPGLQIAVRAVRRAELP